MNLTKTLLATCLLAATTLPLTAMAEEADALPQDAAATTGAGYNWRTFLPSPASIAYNAFTANMGQAGGDLQPSFYYEQRIPRTPSAMFIPGASAWNGQTSSWR